MHLAVMVPNPAWDPEAHAATVETLAGLTDTYSFRVWCDDGCGDCRAQLPDFAAALAAAGIGPERVHQHAVDRIPDGTKRGPLVDAYGIERIPTIVVERDDEEVARYVEQAPVPPAEFLAARLREREAAT